MLGRLAIGKRSLRRAPPWLALLAMVIQFVASYGHLHRQDFNFLERGHGPLSVVSASGLDGGIGDGMSDIDCPICASMALLGSSAPPEGVRLPLPSMHGSVILATIEALHLAPPLHLLFETRGPPLA
jgi:hypothetical protein